MKISSAYRLLLLFFPFFLSPAFSSAQIIVNVNYDDNIHFSEFSFLGTTIRNNSYPDGNYVFYSDSITKTVLFKGTITKGRTNGWYYNNVTNPVTYVDSSVRFMKMVNGLPDSTCRFDHYHCNFKAGKLQWFVVTDFDEMKDQHDSVVVYCSSGKTDSVSLKKADRNSTSNSFLNNALTDTSKLKALGKDAFPIKDENPYDTIEVIPGYLVRAFKEANEKSLADDFLILNIQDEKGKHLFLDSIGTDSAKVKVTYRLWPSVELKYWKWYQFANSDDQITMYYDENYKLRQLIISSFDEVMGSRFELTTLVNIGVKGNVQHITYLTGNLTEISFEENGDQKVVMVASPLEMQLGKDGTLK